MESCAAANIIKCFNFWSAKTLPQERTFSFHVKSSRNWKKTLQKELCGDKSSDYIVPKTYHQLLSQLKCEKVNKKRLVCIVREVDKKFVISGIISTCLSFQNFQPVSILLVKVGNNESGNLIENVGKVVFKTNIKFFHKYTFKMASTVNMHYHFCKNCIESIEPLHD